MVRGPGKRGGQGPVRRARGRTKPIPTSPTAKSNDMKCEMFQGQLCHRTPIRNQKPINEYFVSDCVDPIQDNESLIQETECAAVRTSPRKHQQPMCSVLTSSQPTANGRSSHTPHKIQLCDEETEPLSPTSALSELIILTPRKINKSTLRLSPSQTCNQQTTPTKLKSTDDLVEKHENENSPKLVNGAETIPKKFFNGDNKTCLRPCHTLSEKFPNDNVNGNHKLTEYFPVRRSVRKTKKTVMEEKQKNLEECVLSRREDGLKVVNFEGKGRGVITTRKFSRGEFVVEYSGELIDMIEAKTREESYSDDQNTGCYMYYFKYKNTQYCIDATAESGRLGRLVNHSRNGNLTTKIISIDSIPHLVLIAKDDIDFGEEVCYDYGDRSKESLKYHPWLAS